MPTEADARRLLAALDDLLAASQPERVGPVLREIDACWADRTYQPAQDGAWAQDPAAAAALGVGGMRRALTFYMRADRFADGFHLHAATPDRLGRLRDRLAALLAEEAFNLPACFSPPDVTWAEG